MPIYASIKDKLLNNKKDVVAGLAAGAISLFAGVKTAKWIKKEIQE